MGEIADEHTDQMIFDATPSYRDPMHWVSQCHRCKARVITHVDEHCEMTKWDYAGKLHDCGLPEFNPVPPSMRDKDYGAGGQYE